MSFNSKISCDYKVLSVYLHIPEVLFGRGLKFQFCLFINVFILIACQPKHDLPVDLDLQSNWEFKEVNDSIWRSASVPGNVHSDLLTHQLIEDPFVGHNEAKVQWVSSKDWEYKTKFSLGSEVLNKKNIALKFEGLDTYASVYLNDSLILKANNAFRTWKVNVKSILKLENELKIIFEATSKNEEKEKAKLPYELPEGNRVFTRKAQFQYGWDWGPKLNTNGIWRPIYIEAWNDYKIDDLYVSTNNLVESKADLTIEIGKYSTIRLDQQLTYDIYINDTLQKSLSDIGKGASYITNVEVKNPKLWWPHNIGNPYLYDIKVVARNGKQILDSVSVKHGIRQIQLVTEQDSIGETFYFKVNGNALYAKGANYIPQHSFQNRVEEKDYKSLLDDVVDANMNMLRVWGGGIYENDNFYKLCDEKGILVWQDFMFACAMYPGDTAFLDNVEQEAIDNVKRLRKHPSIALWCGNNENSEGWNRWGWQSGRSEKEKEEIWNNYLKVFDSILPQTVKKYADTDYWESSPKYGRGNPKYKTEGDAHDWWIWHDAFPFEHLEENVPRFMSEFGFQSFPSYETIKYINQNDSIEISSEGFSNHQKHKRGFQLIEKYMKRDFPIPKNAENYVYISQLLQAYGITKGIEAQRRSKPYNMGTLYWQLNDCWPAVSWSSIGFFGNWKALHYKAKRSFDNILISSKVEEDTLKTWIVNDNFEELKGNFKMQILDFDGNIKWEYAKKVNVEPDISTIVSEIPLQSIDFDKYKSVLVSSYNGHSSKFFFVKPKDMDLKNLPIHIEISKIAEGFKLELYSSVFQKDVFLYTDKKGHFSDNYFDLLPNVKRIIYFTSDEKSLQDLRYKTLNSILNSDDSNKPK